MAFPRNKEHYLSAVSVDRNTPALQKVLLRDIEALESVILEQTAKLRIMESYVANLIFNNVISSDDALIAIDKEREKEILSEYQQKRDSFSLEDDLKMYISEKYC